MEIRTLEELFISKYEALEAENAELTEKVYMLTQKNRALYEEVEKAKAFMSEYLSVQFELCGHNGERALLLDKKTNEWFAYGKEERAKAAEAIDYAISMGAKDETKAEKAAEADGECE